MSRRLPWLIIAITIAVAMSAGVYVAKRRQVGAPEVASDAFERLLATRLPDSSGTLQPIAQWRGKVLVVNFWATWCPPCREEMPILSRLQAKFSANGAQVVGIALDTTANVKRFTTSHPVSYPLLTGDSSASELSRLLGNTQLALPYTVVFDDDGSARMKRLGRISEAELDTLLSKLVAK